MNDFNPVRNVEHSQVVLDHGLWPNFKEAKISNLVFRGNDDIHTGNRRDEVTIEISFELHESNQPYIVVLQFNDCDSIYRGELNHRDPICDLQFAYKARGTDIEGDPLPRSVSVHFEEVFGKALFFNCLKVQALERHLKYETTETH